MVWPRPLLASGGWLLVRTLSRRLWLRRLLLLLLLLLLLWRRSESGGAGRMSPASRAAQAEPVAWMLLAGALVGAPSQGVGGMVWWNWFPLLQVHDDRRATRGQPSAPWLRQQALSDGPQAPVAVSLACNRA